MSFGAKKTADLATIKEPNIKTFVVRIEGTAPYVQHRFANKAAIMRDMATPKNEKPSKKDRPVRDYEKEFKAAQHVSPEGWHGIPAASFRAAMIDACRTVGATMTTTKMAVFVVADGYDQDDMPIVKIQGGKPEMREDAVRNDNESIDIRVRPMWKKWFVDLKLEIDLDMTNLNSIVNLLSRAGRQCGIGEGRPFSKTSCGLGWGTFKVVQK